MTLPEIQELMNLKGMSRTQLAGALDLTEATVHKWFRTGQVPGGPAHVLMSQWLDQARKDAKLKPVHA